MDKIILRNINAYGSIGFYPEERVLGQWFVVDLTVYSDLAAASRSDRLDQTIDYQHIIQQVQTQIKRADCHLIEHLAQRILDDLFRSPLISRITIRVTKPNPPIPDFSGQVSVEMTRDRPIEDQ